MTPVPGHGAVERGKGASQRQKKMLKQRPGQKVRWRLMVNLQRQEVVVTDRDTPSQQDRRTEIHPPVTASISQKQRATLRYTRLETD